jgi:hypothetical protein
MKTDPYLFYYYFCRGDARALAFDVGPMRESRRQTRRLSVKPTLTRLAMLLWRGVSGMSKS